MRGSHVALVVTDEVLLPSLRRLCAVAGYDADVVADLRAVRRAWSTSAAVIVESRLASVLADAGLPRRPGLVVVCPAEPEAAEWRLGVDLGAEAVVHPATGEQTLVELLTRLGDPGVMAKVIGCVPAVGGAGSSTLAVSLAQSAAASGPVTLLDADSCSGGIDLLMGIERSPGRRWPDLVASRGVIAASALRDELPVTGDVAVVSCGQEGQDELPVDAMTSVLDASRRGSRTVVVDLPRRLCASAEVAAAACDTVFVIVPLQVRAVVAGTWLVGALRQLCADVRVVVREPGPADLTAEHVARKLGVPVAAAIRTDRRIGVMSERGELHRLLRRTHLARTASALVATAAGEA